MGRALDWGGGFFAHDGAGRAAVAGAAARGKKSSDMTAGSFLRARMGPPRCAVRGRGGGWMGW
ncbi:hypothetical protein GCM10027072_55480 [Streptomyces bullii]